MNKLMQHLLELQLLEFNETVQPDIEDRIAELRAKIPAAILGHYDRLGDRGKKGVAVIRNQVCTGCHMRVPIAVVVELRRGADVRLCDNCGRYLYVEDILPAGPVAPVAPVKKTAVKRSKPVAA